MRQKHFIINYEEIHKLRKLQYYTIMSTDKKINHCYKLQDTWWKLQDAHDAATQTARCTWRWDKNCKIYTRRYDCNCKDTHNCMLNSDCHKINNKEVQSVTLLIAAYSWQYRTLLTEIEWTFITAKVLHAILFGSGACNWLSLC